MSLWKSTDANTSAPLYALAQLSVSPTQANMNIAYGNVTTGVYGTGVKKGVFGVDAAEMAVASNPHGGHAGWVIRTEGTGGRAGRIHIETLVAMGSMTGDGGAVANDDVQFADS